METTKWYLSKLNWLGVIQFLIGALAIVGEFVKNNDFSPYATTLLFTGILTVVLRTWFTSTPIS